MDSKEMADAQKDTDKEVFPQPIALEREVQYGALVTDPGILLLYQIIDDISTLSDMIKPNNEEGYRAHYKAVLRQISRKEAIFESDGYSVFRKDETGIPYPQCLYRRARELWGDDRQWIKFAEELSECSAAILRWRNYGGSADSVAEEMADVEIMGGQCRLMVGNHLVDSWKKKKLERLEAMLKGDKK